MYVKIHITGSLTGILLRLTFLTIGFGNNFMGLLVIFMLKYERVCIQP